MPLELELHADLMEKLNLAAENHGLTANSLAVLAIAEKLARMEHEDWLVRSSHSPQSTEEKQAGKDSSAR